MEHRPGGGSRGQVPQRGDIDYRPRWVSDAIFYQIFPDRFARSDEVPKPSNLEHWGSEPTVHGYKGGDLIGIVEHLDHLQDLGVTALYLNPIFQSASNHRYHPHDFDRVDPLLGGDSAFDRLLKACHDRGLRVVLDGVFDHASRGFFRFNDILENGQASPWVDWFHIQDPPINGYDESRPPGYRAWWGLHALPKLNTENPEVREYLMQVGERWVARGIDGWRLDVPEEIATEGFWEEFRARVRAVNPDTYIVGEIWREAPDWTVDPLRFDGVMNYPLAEAVLRFAAGDRIAGDVVADVQLTLVPRMDAAAFRGALDSLMAVYPKSALESQLNLLGSHDTPRVLSMVGEDRSSVLLAAAIVFTVAGAPCIYYGDEIGLTGLRDPGCRGTFPWEKTGSWDGGLLAAFRSLALLRRAHAALRRGDHSHLLADGPLYVFERSLADERMIVAVNVGTERAEATLAIAGDMQPRWGEGVAISDRSGSVRLKIPGRSAGVWQVS